MLYVRKAVEYIEQNLENDLSFVSIAGAVDVSPFHLARSFRAIVGISPMGYVQRRRLTEIAKLVLNHDGRLLDFAVRYRFGSHEALSRAFKKSFGMSPSSLRSRESISDMHFLEAFDDNAFVHNKQNVSLEPRIVELPKFWVVGLERTFDDENKHMIPGLWQEFAQVSGQIVTANDNYYGVSDCKDVYACEFSYMAAVSVTESDDCPRGMQLRSIDESTYACFEQRTVAQDIHAQLQATMRYIWSTWLPRSKFEFAETCDFELYGPKFDLMNRCGVIEIYIPVRPKGEAG